MKKSCKNCAYRITEDPHTCDECTSLANDEHYTMWKKDKAKYKKLYIKTIRELQNLNIHDEVEIEFGESIEHLEIRRDGYKNAIDDIVSEMIWKIHIANIE